MWIRIIRFFYFFYLIHSLVDTKSTPLVIESTSWKNGTNQFVEYLGARPELPNYKDFASKYNLKITGALLHNSEANYTHLGVPYLLVSSQNCPEERVCPIVYLLKSKFRALYTFLTYINGKGELNALPFFLNSVSHTISPKKRNFLYFYGNNFFFERPIEMNSPRRLKICRKHFSQCNERSIQLNMVLPGKKKVLGRLKIVRLAMDHYLISVFVGPDLDIELVSPLPFHFMIDREMPMFYVPLYGKIY